MIRFPSLTRSNTTAYTITRNWNERITSRDVNSSVGEWAVSYDTYGHGLAQHEPDHPVWLEHAADYLASLASFILNGAEPEALQTPSERSRDQQEALKALAKHWPHTHYNDVPMVRFYHTVRYDSEKKRWYSPEHLRISSAESKAKSREWKKIESWHDGSIKSIDMLIPDRYYGIAARLYKFKIILDMLESDGGGWQGRPVDFVMARDAESRAKRGMLQDAFEACNQLVIAFRATESAQTNLHNFLSTAKPKAKMVEVTETENIPD